MARLSEKLWLGAFVVLLAVGVLRAEFTATDSQTLVVMKDRLIDITDRVDEMRSVVGALTDGPTDGILGGVERIEDQFESLLYLAAVCAAGVGVVWGAITWRLVVLAKNQRSFWVLVLMGCLTMVPAARAWEPEDGPCPFFYGYPEAWGEAMYPSYQVTVTLVEGQQISGCVEVVAGIWSGTTTVTVNGEQRTYGFVLEQVWEERFTGGFGGAKEYGRGYRLTVNRMVMEGGVPRLWSSSQKGLGWYPSFENWGWNFGATPIPIAPQQSIEGPTISSFDGATSRGCVKCGQVDELCCFDQCCSVSLNASSQLQTITGIEGDGDTVLLNSTPDPTTYCQAILETLQQIAGNTERPAAAEVAGTFSDEWGDEFLDETEEELPEDTDVQYGMEGVTVLDTGIDQIKSLQVGSDPLGEAPVAELSIPYHVQKIPVVFDLTMTDARMYGPLPASMKSTIGSFKTVSKAAFTLLFVVLFVCAVVRVFYNY